MIRFALIGDMGTGDDNQKRVAKSLKKIIDRDSLQFVCGMGDNIYDCGVVAVDDIQFKNKFEKPYQKIDNKIKFLIDQDVPNVLYNDTLGLRFKIPATLNVYWDVEKIEEVGGISVSDVVGSEISVDTENILYSNNVGTSENPKYKYLNITFNNFAMAESFILDNFYIVPETASSGYFSVALDGSNNALVVFDDKIKYVSSVT